MSKLPSVPIVQRAVASRDDVRHVLGDMEDAKIMDILALRPSLAEVEAAAMWTTGDGDILAKGGRPLEGVVADIVGLLAKDEEDLAPDY